jgi:hypothetical protein
MEEQLPLVNAVPRAYLYTIPQFHLLVAVYRTSVSSSRIGLVFTYVSFLLHNFHTINYLQFYFSCTSVTFNAYCMRNLVLQCCLV